VHTPNSDIPPSPLTARARRIKRVVDLGLVVLLLPLALPLAVCVAAAIFLTDGGPVFFSQDRIGRGGRRFRLLKFRTLRTGPKDPSRPSDYVTPVGRVLRQWGLDELPQFMSVLRGTMSLVGPRPALPEQVARYGPFERRRLSVSPGLTGWAQINGRNSISWPERIALDVWYASHQSLRLDLSILVRTPLVLLRGQDVDGEDGRNPTFPAAPTSSPTPSSHE